jgi:hypothetical protein
MKRGAFVLPLVLIFGQLLAQTDDGYITRRLPINTTQERIVSYTNGFTTGLSKVRRGELLSADAVKAYYGIDLTTFPKWDQWANPPAGSGISAGFVQKLNAVFQKIGDAYLESSQIRQAFQQIAIAGGLSTKEAETLALIDLSLQALIRSSVSGEFNLRSVIGDPVRYIYSDHTVFTEQAEHDYDLYPRLPRWLRCGLGVIGSSIMGGLTGAAAGVQVGAQLGAAVGGVLGVISGAFVGAATFCD